MPPTLDQLYSELWEAHGDACAELDQSLHPRSGEALYQAAVPLLHTGSRVLDAGCGRGLHALEPARRCGCRVIGIDAVRAPLAAAGAGIFAQARWEAIPAPDAVFDLVWCRDMLVHAPDFDGAIVECARVPKPG